MKCRTDNFDAQHAVAGFMADWRAEVVAACLSEYGCDRDRILFKRLGNNKRSVAREIERVGILYPISMPGERFVEIEVNRASLYDSLPEGIFHDSLPAADNGNQARIIAGIRSDDRLEQDFRQLLRLFEAEFDFGRLDVQMSEMRFDMQDSYRDFARIFEPYWEILKELTLRQANLFIKCLPTFHAIRRDCARMGRVIGTILEAPVSVCARYADRDIGDTPRMQDMRLDGDFVLPGRHHDGLPDFVVTVGDIGASCVRDFLPGAKMRRVLEQLCSMLLPADSGVEIKITVVQEERTLHLAGEAERYPCYLGINTYLVENKHESEKQ